MDGNMNKDCSGLTMPSVCITLEFPFRAVSFQQARYGKGRVFKTKKQEDFETKISSLLLMDRLKVNQFASLFDPEIHVIQSSWKFLYSDFFTKDNNVSSRCLDLDNSIKNIQDVIYKFMGINDKYIVKTDLHKWEGEEDGIFCSFRLLKRDEIKFIFHDFEEIIK
jgi:Holliday junction resolvase RusA-like endonuclease